MSSNPVTKLFRDKLIVKKIKSKLPKLFAIAELEASRNGKIGMEVGSLREQILVALLVSVFGEKNVNNEIPITKPEIDVEVLKTPLSIKTITGINGFKAVWTVDAESAKKFAMAYKPSCDILLAIISWNSSKYQTGLFLIPLEVQKTVFTELGRENYLSLPKIGTNPRGVEVKKNAVMQLIKNKNTSFIQIDWKKDKVKYKTYKRWLELWEERS